MSRTFEHGAIRTAPPRRKNLPQYTAPQPDGNRGPGGRFLPGNDTAKRKAIRSLLKRQLGSEATTEEVEQLYRETMVQFRACLADLPANDAAEVQDLTARRARWSVLSARYAAKAAEVGLFTEQGGKLLEMALKLDARAERLAVTARDEAERCHATRGDRNDADVPWLRARPAAPLPPPKTTPSTSESESASVGQPGGSVVHPDIPSSMAEEPTP